MSGLQESIINDIYDLAKVLTFDFKSNTNRLSLFKN